MAGGSPMARAISRWAWAKRVSESISNRTFLPLSRKYSAMRVQYIAARKRISGASSAGDATTTERLSPSSPRICSMNSLTSRPRSPIRPTTMMSASVKRVIMPNSTLLPTPVPANRPRRWPRPTVNKPLMLRIPTSSGWLIGSRLSGLMVGPSIGTQSSAFIPPLPSRARPAPSSTRPSMLMPIGRRPLSASGTTRAPGAMPATLPTGMRNTLPPAKPMTSASTRTG
ncbi:hypothetical protein D3C81_1403430 [compost metagenome]